MHGRYPSPMEEMMRERNAGGGALLMAGVVLGVVLRAADGREWWLWLGWALALALVLAGGFLTTRKGSCDGEGEIEPGA